MNTQTKEEMITISKEEYDGLLEDSDFLTILINNGIDNWDGYDMCREEYNRLYNNE